MRIKIHVHINGFAFHLALKQRLQATRRDISSEIAYKHLQRGTGSISFIFLT